MNQIGNDIIIYMKLYIPAFEYLCTLQYNYIYNSTNYTTIRNNYDGG